MYLLRIISRRFNGLTASALVTKVEGPWPRRSRVSPHTILHRELANLGVKLFDLAVIIPSLFDFIRDHPGHASNRLSFQRDHLRWVELPLGCDLLHRLVTAQRFKRHSSLKLVGKVMSFCHSRIYSLGLDIS